jgi:hypothetical protein
MVVIPRCSVLNTQKFGNRLLPNCLISTTMRSMFFRTCQSYRSTLRGWQIRWQASANHRKCCVAAGDLKNPACKSHFKLVVVRNLYLNYKRLSAWGYVHCSRWKNKPKHYLMWPGILKVYPYRCPSENVKLYTNISWQVHPNWNW